MGTGLDFEELAKAVLQDTEVRQVDKLIRTIENN